MHICSKNNHKTKKQKKNAYVPLLCASRAVECQGGEGGRAPPPTVLGREDLRPHISAVLYCKCWTGQKENPVRGGGERGVVYACVWRKWRRRRSLCTRVCGVGGATATCERVCACASSIGRKLMDHLISADRQCRL